MSELKVFNSERIYWAVEQVEREAGDIDTLHLDDSQFYLKSEADKVIAEKDKEIARLDDLAHAHNIELLLKENVIADKDKELRHHKYKRCLDKAKWCFTKSNYHFVLARHGENGKENNRRSILYAKWHKRWLKIAAKIKEAK